MKLIRPTAITDTILNSTTVVETPPAAYVGGTTYALGASVSTGTVGSVITVWGSLQAGNVGHTPASSPDWWVQTGTTYSVYAGGTTYGAAARVIDPANHLAYESLAGGNVGNALTDVTKWKPLGATNQWAMFDRLVGTKTSNPDSIEIELEPGLIDSLALLEVSAAEVVVTITDPVEGEVYSHTESMVSDSGITDWYLYFFEPIIRKTSLVLLDLPQYLAGVMAISINDTGSNAECGVLVTGQSRYLGETLYGMRSTIIDYSKKTTDDNGTVTITERGYANRLDTDLRVPKTLVDETKRLLASYRATPAVWVGEQSYDLSIVYGFYKDFSVVVAGINKCSCSLQIEGLI